MRFTSGVRLKNSMVASILSFLIAGAICALTSPVNSAAGVAISVNRDAKGDSLLPAVHPIRRDSIKNEKPAERNLVGCEPAFSPFARPHHTQIFTHCAA
jgi:hypothetical protein